MPRFSTYIKLFSITLLIFTAVFVALRQPIPTVFGQQGSSQCVPGGCSRQLCIRDGQQVSTTCEYREEYACYTTATCEEQADGQCGWTQTEELTACLAGANPTPGVSMSPITLTPTISPAVTNAPASCEGGIPISELNFDTNPNIKIEKIEALNQAKVTHALNATNATKLEDGFGIAFAIDLKAGERVEIEGSEISNVNGSYVRSYAFDPDNKIITFDGEEEMDTRVRFLPKKTGSYHIVFATFDCKEGNIWLNAYQDSLLFPEILIERLDKTTIAGFYIQPEDRARIGKTPAKIHVNFPKLDSVERVSGTQDKLSLTYQQLNSDTGQMKPVTGTLELFMNSQPTTVTTNTDNDWTFFPETNRAAYPPTELDFEVNGNTLTLLSAVDENGGYFPENFQYVLQIRYTATPLSSIWSTRFSTVDTKFAVGRNSACHADITGDGTVDLTDYSTLVTNFFKDTKSCTQRE